MTLLAKIRSTGWRASSARPLPRGRTTVLTSPPRRPCATPRSGCAWCGARPGSACTKSTGSRGGATGRPSCARSCACRPMSTSTATPICSSSIIPTDMRTRFREKLQASLAPESGGDYEDEHRITRFDGTTGWILLRGKTFFQDTPSGKRPTRSIGLIVDITDRKVGEEANALHASTVHSSTDAIFSIDPDRTIQDLESAARSASTATRRRRHRATHLRFSARITCTTNSCRFMSVRRAGRR